MKWYGYILWSLLIGVEASLAAPTEPFVIHKFYKGNLHTHTNRTDGDASPEFVIQTYKEAGYNFLAITDHNIVVDPSEFSSMETEDFKLMPGEELSYATPNFHPPGSFWGRPLVSIHGNALCTRTKSGGARYSTAREALNAIVAQMKQVAPVFQINHPNYESALDFQDFADIADSYLLEISNQHPFVNNEAVPAFEGDDQIPVEVLWDQLLSSGQKAYGTATDDGHDYLYDPGFTRRVPLLGWVQVSAPELQIDAICRSLARGKFYSSTGVELLYVQFSGTVLSLATEQLDEVISNIESSEITIPEYTYITEFIGSGGEILKTDESFFPFYELNGTEKYVRAVVKRNDGRKAWVQPVFLQ